MLRLCVTFFCLLYGVKTGRKSIVLILLFSITAYSALEEQRENLSALCIIRLLCRIFN